MNKSIKTAIKNYGADQCVRAYLMNRQDGEGAASIANGAAARSYGPIDSIRTTRQADAAINAGEWLTK